jgi:hypothetical protein
MRPKRAEKKGLMLINKLLHVTLYIYIYKTSLQNTQSQCSLSRDGIAEVNWLINYISKFETLILLNVWRDILDHINVRSLILQPKG